MKRFLGNAVLPSQKRPQTLSGPNLPEQPAPILFPDGVEILRDCSDAIVDICFVHGLTGDRRSTWTAHEQSTPWPKTLLRSQLDKARILTYGYDAYVVRKSVAGENRLIDHATNLLHDLTTERDSSDALHRPIIFVAHSLGGLVCKEAILLSRDNPEAHLQGIFDQTVGIVFMGTPHRGAWMADWASIPLSALGLTTSANKSLLEILETENQFLESIQVRFWSMIRKIGETGRKLEITCFFEELPLPVVGKVVSKASATFEGYNSISIHANHRDMVKFQSADENGFKRLVGELHRWVKKIDEKPKLDSDCLKSLAFPEMDLRSQEIDAAAEGTCKWLLRHETYKNWTCCDRALLWIKGKPGSGKSTLLRYALLSNLSRAPDIRDRTLVLTFFFHARGTELQRTPLGFFRSLLHQILTQIPETLADLVATFQQRCVAFGESGEKWHWNLHELQRFFESSLARILERLSVRMYVDALDECGRENALHLLQYFKSWTQELPLTRSQLTICLTSREYPILNLHCPFEIHVDRENRQDIETYVQAQLSEFRDRTGSTILTTITERARGIFLWAYLAVRRVLDLELEGKGLKIIEESIFAIPHSLDKLYDDLVRGMDEKLSSLKLFQWICFATRPLSLDELRWALLLDADSSYKSLEQCQEAGDFAWDSSTMERRLKTLSRGLVEIVPSSYNKQVVQFIHQSVQDFFINKGLAALEDSLISSEMKASRTCVAGNAHYQLSRTCIRYLAMEEVVASSTTLDRDDLVNFFPLLHYATTSWVAHTTFSEIKEHPQDDLLHYFAWPSEHMVQLWVRLYHIIEPRWGDCPRNATSMLHIVSQYHFVRPLYRILQGPDQGGTFINVKDDYGQTPLSWAAKKGHETVVKLLVATDKVIVNEKDIEGQTPLSWAARNGHEAVIKLLVATDKVDLDTKDREGQTPLSWAARNGHEAVFQLLVATDKVDLDTKDREGRTPLLWASENRNEAIVKLLIARRVEINAKDIRGRTALSRAVKTGYLDIIQVLVSTEGVQINAKDNDGRTPLSLAAKSGHETVVKFLLQVEGINVLAKDNNGQTALLQAAQAGYLDIFQVLVATEGVQINAKDYDGRTPLSLAAKSGHETVVKFLLQLEGIDVLAKDNNGQTALLQASQAGYLDVVQVLVATEGVQINAKDNDGRTPLSLAAKDGHETVVKFLLQLEGIDVLAKDNNGQTALLQAAQAGYLDVVQVLVATEGVQINAKDNDGRTPLSLAAKDGHETVVKFLLQVEGIDVLAKDIDGQTALSLGAKGKLASVVELLLAIEGADVNSKDNSGRTPLSWAAGTVAEMNRSDLSDIYRKWETKEACSFQCYQTQHFLYMDRVTIRKRESVVKLLLDKDGVDIDSADNNGRRPLFYATANGYETIVKLLIESGKVDINVKDHDGWTPLLYAAKNGYETIVKLLIESGKVDINVKDHDGWTPLLYAAENGHETTVQLLIATGRVDIDVKDHNGRTPLLHAATNGHETTVQLLIATGRVDIDVRDNYGRTPLLYAAANGHETTVHLLIATGRVDIDVRDNSGWTPLLDAAANGHETTVQLLIATGRVDIDAKDNYGWTPLLYAAAKGHEPTVQLLVATGKVDVNLRDPTGRTVLWWATRTGKLAAVHLLLAANNIEADTCAA